MRPRTGVALLTAASLAIGASASRVRAQARGDEVVARVGSTEITAGALEQRLKALPDFQLASLGATPEERKRRLLEEVLIKEALFAEAAKARQLERTSPARER